MNYASTSTWADRKKKNHKNQSEVFLVFYSFNYHAIKKLQEEAKRAKSEANDYKSGRGREEIWNWYAHESKMGILGKGRGHVSYMKERINFSIFFTSRAFTTGPAKELQFTRLNYRACERTTIFAA